MSSRKNGVLVFFLDHVLCAYVTAPLVDDVERAGTLGWARFLLWIMLACVVDAPDVT